MKKTEKGQALIAAIFVLLVIGLFGAIGVSMLSTESISVMRNLHGIQALNVAEGGMRFTIATSLAASSDWSTLPAGFGPVSLYPGTFSVQFTYKTQKSCTVEVTGTVQGVSRVVRTGFKKGGLPSQFTEYGVYGGDGGSIGDTVTWYNNSQLIGSFFFYGNVVIAGVRPPPCQTNGVIRSLTISPLPAAGVPDYYASWEAATTFEAINWDDSYYAGWLSVANRPATYGAITLTGTANKNLSDEPNKTWFVRSLTMRQNSTVTGPGTICATALPLGTGAVLTYDNARFIGGPVRIIARGTVTSVRFNDFTSFTHTPEVIAYDNLIIDDDVATPYGSVLYSRSGGGAARGVQTNLRARARGTFLAPYGRVSNNNDATIEGLSYSYDYQAYNSAVHRGGAVFRRLGSFYNNAKIISDQSVLPPTTPTGISSEGTASFEVGLWVIQDY